MTSKVFYCGHPTKIDLSDQVNSYKYMKNIIIPNQLLDDAKLLSKIKYFKITKNDKIKNLLENLKKHQNDEITCIFAYGQHLQKALSVVELYKTKILLPDKVMFKQWNKLLSFDVISQGKNELLDKKIKVPILLIFITTNQEYFKLETFINETNGFSEQE